MNQEDILWRQKANSQSSTFKNFGYFLYEFIGARFTLLAFIALFNVAAFGLNIDGFEYFSHFLSLSIALFLYYVISDAFNIFWTGVNLEYLVTKDNIKFKWGVTRSHDLLVPLDQLTKISAQYGPHEKRSAIIFENKEKIKNGDFGFSKERYFNQLSFENISDIESLIKILNEIASPKVERISGIKKFPWDEQLPSSTVYLKVLQLIAFVFLYLFTSIGLQFVDNNILPGKKVKDMVVLQEPIKEVNGKFINHFETKEGHTIILESGYRHQYKYLGKEVEFHLSPMYKHVTKFGSLQVAKYESFRNGYKGIGMPFKFLTLLSLLFSSSYIFYKRGVVPIEELSIILLLPLILLFVAFVLFT